MTLYEEIMNGLQSGLDAINNNDDIRTTTASNDDKDEGDSLEREPLQN